MVGEEGECRGAAPKYILIPTFFQLHEHDHSAQVVQLLQLGYHDDLQVQNYLEIFAQPRNPAKDQNHISF